LCVDLTSIRLIGRRVYLRFDPEDLTRLDVFWEGRRAAAAAFGNLSRAA
jgi:hypothetical protein